MVDLATGEPELGGTGLAASPADIEEADALSYLSLSEVAMYRPRAGRLAVEGVSAESISGDVQCIGEGSEGVRLMLVWSKGSGDVGDVEKEGTERGSWARADLSAASGERSCFRTPP